MSKLLCCLVLGALGCDQLDLEESAVGRPALVTVATNAACLDPIAYGAISGDELSDRAAFQAAVDAAAISPDGGTVCIGPGRWTMERAPAGSYDRFATLSTHGHYVTIRGAGPETVLELVGDQGASAVTVISVDPGAEHVRISDLTIDTIAATNTDEQTHAIATGTVCSTTLGTCTPIRDLQIERVTFRHPRNTPSRKGDCIRTLGNTPATAVIGVRIVGNNFEDCARSAWQIQRNTTDAVFANNTVRCVTCDQDVDGEATGGGFDTRLVIANNTFLDEPTVQGSFTIALTNTNGATITGNTMNRGIAVYRSTSVVISGNTIDMLASTDAGLIDASNLCEGLAITGNVLRRAGHIGPLVKLGPHSGALCGGVTVAGNVMQQGTGFHAVYMESVSRASIAANQITYTVPAPAYSAIYDRSVIAASPVHTLGITGNAISGAVTYGVTIDGSPGTVAGGVSVTNNVATGTTFGLRCNNGFGFTAPVVSSGNSMGPGAWAGVTVQAGN